MTRVTPSSSTRPTGRDDGFAEANNGEEFGGANLPVVINSDASDPAGGNVADMLNTENGGWAAGTDAGLAITGLLAGIANGDDQTCRPGATEPSTTSQ